MSGLLTGKGDHRKIDFANVGGDVFRYVETKSDNFVLWGELWKENERQLMKHEMQTSFVRLLLVDCFQIVTRAIWQPQAKQNGHHAAMRYGPCAVLLHAFDQRECGGWRWMKLARPLYRRGFSIVSLEFPGHGGSTMNGKSDVVVDAWRKRGNKLIAETMLELNVSAISLVAEGESCEFAVELLGKVQHRSERKHVFHNPIFDLDRLFPPSPPRPERGQAFEEWQRIVQEGQLGELERTLRLSDSTLFITVDESVASAKVLQTVDTLAYIKATSLRMSAKIIIERVTKAEVCVAQVGATVNTPILVFSRWLRETVADFLAGREIDLRPAPDAPETPELRLRDDQRSAYTPSAASDRGIGGGTPAFFPGSLPSRRPSNQSTGELPRSRSSTAFASGGDPARSKSSTAFASGGEPKRSRSSTALASGGEPGRSRSSTASGARPKDYHGASGQLSTRPSKGDAGADVGSATSMALARMEDRPRSRGQLALPVPTSGSRSRSSTAGAGAPTSPMSPMSPMSPTSSASGASLGRLPAGSDFSRAAVYTIKQLSASQRNITAPQEFRFKMLSKVPRAMRPMDWDQLKVPLDIPRDMTPAEIRDLEDGVDASLALLVADQPRDQPRGQPETPELHRHKTVEGRRAMWKAANQDMRRTMTMMASVRSKNFTASR